MQMISSAVVLADDFGEFIGIVCGGVFGLALLIVWIFSIVWVYGDAEKRGKSGCLVAILVALLSWPLGLIVWLVFRPNEHDH